MDKLIITIAPTGSVPRKEQNPHVPVTPKEIVETAQKCEEAGAAVIHIHARDNNQNPSPDFAIFREIYEGVKAETGLITQISTGARAGQGYETRSDRLTLKPEMASLTTGSVNFPNAAYVNEPNLIDALAADMKRLNIKPEMEIFDVSMIENALALRTQNLVETPLHFNLVMGLRGAIPATIRNLVHLYSCLPEDCTWTVSGIGAAQLNMNVHAMLMGGHVRVGLEDNIHYDKSALATNEMLVERIVRLAKELGRETATPDEARKIMGLKNSI